VGAVGGSKALGPRDALNPSDPSDPLLALEEPSAAGEQPSSACPGPRELYASIGRGCEPATEPAARGNARIREGTSGCGASSATNRSIWRELLCLARVSNLQWLSGVRCLASRTIALRCSSPRATICRITGKRRAVRAAQMRLAVIDSDM
jgi:hypothetical protein